MTVKELKDQLEKVPEDASVRIYFEYGMHAVPEKLVVCEYIGKDAGGFWAPPPHSFVFGIKNIRGGRG